MYTKPVVIYKKNNNVYVIIFEAGNGGAWNDWYRIYKKAANDEEVIKWAEKVVLNSKWANQYKVRSREWIIEMFGLSKEEMECPNMAGQDYGCYDKDKKRFIINGGFEINMMCESNECLLVYNSGTRNSPVFKKVKVAKPKWYYDISFGAGRSSKETVYFAELPSNVIYHNFIKI